MPNLKVSSQEFRYLKYFALINIFDIYNRARITHVSCMLQRCYGSCLHRLQKLIYLHVVHFYKAAQKVNLS